ncbi:MAG: ATP-binding protein [Terracidiphilus sp.]
MPAGSIPKRRASRAARGSYRAVHAARLAQELFFGMLTAVALGTILHWLHWLSPVGLLIYVPAVATFALLCGSGQALVVGIAAVLTQTFFAARHGHLGIETAVTDAIALLIFALVAVYVGRLSARADDEDRETASLSKEVSELLEFTRRTLQMDLQTEPGQQLAELIREAFDLESAAIFDADLHQVYKSGMWFEDPQELALNIYHFGTSDDDPETGLTRRAVRLGTVPIGSMAVRGKMTSLTASFIASLVAISFDRYRALANENRIEAERRTEQLRSAVLDGLGHAYKTPLTAIRAASTGLMEMGGLSSAQAELAALISDQANLLSDLTTRLLTTARLDAQEVVVNANKVSVGPMIEEAVAGLGEQRSGIRVSIDLPDEGLELNCDRRLMVMLLTQYIDNACKYSMGGPITVRAGLENAEVVFSVHSFGPVIPVADRERIFDRYYRSSASSPAADGTGIGLSVAKRAAAIHGGSVWVSSNETAGTTFYAAIPAETMETVS